MSIDQSQAANDQRKNTNYQLTKENQKQIPSDQGHLVNHLPRNLSLKMYKLRTTKLIFMTK